MTSEQTTSSEQQDTARRLAIFVASLLGVVTVLIPMASVLPAAVKKIWLFPLLLALLLALLARFISQQSASSLSPRRQLCVVLAILVLQIALAWDGHRQLEAARRTSLKENVIAAGMYEQLADQQRNDQPLADPTQIGWTTFLTHKYAALKLPVGWIYPWWIFEMVSTSLFGVWIAGRVWPQPVTSPERNPS